MKSFVRQFVFIQPDVVVVFDRVVSTKPEFRKTWLLHSVDEPQDGRGRHVVRGVLQSRPPRVRAAPAGEAAR